MLFVCRTAHPLSRIHTLFCSRLYIHRYIHVKRRNQTFCLLCDESDTVESLKQKIVQALQQHSTDEVPTMRLQLTTDATVLEDEQPLRHYQVKDNDVLHMVYAVSDDEYETVDITSTEVQDS